MILSTRDASSVQTYTSVYTWIRSIIGWFCLAVIGQSILLIIYCLPTTRTRTTTTGSITNNWNACFSFGVGRSMYVPNLETFLKFKTFESEKWKECRNWSQTFFSGIKNLKNERTNTCIGTDGIVFFGENFDITHLFTYWRLLYLRLLMFQIPSSRETVTSLNKQHCATQFFFSALKEKYTEILKEFV